MVGKQEEFYRIEHRYMNIVMNGRNNEVKITKNILMPLYHLLNISGLIPFTQNPLELKFHKFKTLYGIIIAFMSVESQISLSDWTLDNIKIHSSILKFVMKSKLPLTLLGLLSSYFIIYSSRKELQNIIREFICSHSQLSEMSALEGVKRSINPLKRWSIGLSIFYVINLTRFIFIRIAMLMIEKADSDCLSKAFIENSQMLLCLCFIFLLILMKERFVTINRLVNLKIEESRNQQKYPERCDDFSKHVDKIVSVHYRNTKLMEKINSIFSFVLLVNLVVTFLTLLGGIHLLLCKFTFHIFQNKFFETLDLLITRFIMAIIPLVMAQKSVNLSNQAAATSKRLLGIDIHPEKEEAADCIITASLRLMQKKLEITACSLFTIDNTLIFSSISAGSTYLFVMMQYELEHSKIVQSYSNSSIIQQ